jgi:OFA family oxalate/formate antiporter-like MFS transporter
VLNSSNDDTARGNKHSTSLNLPLYSWTGNRLFYGWIIVAVGAITQFFQGLGSQGFTTYLDLLQKNFGWSRAVLAGPRSVTAIQGSVTGPLSGFLVDRFGPRAIVTVGIFIMGLGFILFGMTNSLWLYYVANIVIALGTSLQGLLVMSVAVNNWFKRNRTIAQSIMSLGFSMAGVVGVPLLVLIQSWKGWQFSAIGSGLLIWAIGFPCAMLLRTKPELYGLQPDGHIFSTTTPTVGSHAEAGAEADFTLSEAIHTRAFWLLCFGWAIGNLGISAVQVHLFLHLEQGIGLSRSMAGLVWTVASISNIPSRLIGGFFGDRFPKRVMLGSASLFMAVSILVLGIATSTQMAFVYAVLFGIGWGIQTPTMNAIQAEYFGRKSLGIIIGWLQSLSIPFSIAAPIVTGHIADLHQGNYRIAFIVISLIMFFGAGLLFLAIHPKAPQRK